jgi:hypothetical protein
MPDELTYMTDAHTAVIKALERRGLGLMYEVDFPPYRVDIYLPDFHVAVEVDGPRHTDRVDRKRDHELGEEYRLRIFHISAADAYMPSMWLAPLGCFLSDARESKDERWGACEIRTPWL